MNLKKVGTFLAAVLLFLATWADICDDVGEVIKSGNASLVAAYFGANVDLTILEKESMYSKVQAEQILKEFYQKNTPKSFSLIHRGTSKDGSKYVIGNLETTVGVNYRTYYLIKQASGKSIIQELRFEKE